MANWRKFSIKEGTMHHSFIMEFSIKEGTVEKWSNGGAMSARFGLSYLVS